MTDLDLRPVDSTNWADLERLFESRGGPHSCWCMVWRNMASGLDRSKKTDKKSSLKQEVDNHIPIGLICYENEEPIAWCSVGPRHSFRNLGGDNELDDVWSLTCMFIKRAYRTRGISEHLIQGAIAYSKKNKAAYLEAYPVDSDSPSYRFMGFLPVFEKLGFEFTHRVGKRRNVVKLKL